MSGLSFTAPSIAGKDLLDKPVRIPEDLPPGPCVLMLAFSPGHQSEAVSWVPALTDLATSGKATIRQLIVLPAFAKIGERIVIDQLLKTVPPEAHDATVLVFSDPGDVAKSVGAEDTSHVALALVDASRHVVWTGSGPHAPATEAALRAALGA
jgi:hypothetical protein